MPTLEEDLALVARIQNTLNDCQEALDRMQTMLDAAEQR